MRPVVKQRVNSRPFAVSAAGAVSVFAVHALLVLPFILNLSVPSPRPPITRSAGTASLISTAEPEMIVVFIDQTRPAENGAPPDKPQSSQAVALLNRHLIVQRPDAFPATPKTSAAVSDDAPEDGAAAEVAAEYARLYGRYLGQLQARVERAWMRPRTAIGSAQFSCWARIQQNRRGDEVAIALDHCNGTERWQQSLVSAIRTAAPLPAPPDASVYADVLWLSFSSEAFKEGSSVQGFEPQTRPTNVGEPSILESFQRFASRTRGDSKSGEGESAEIIHLTIIGTRADDPSMTSQAPAEPPPPSAELEPQPPASPPQ